LNDRERLAKLRAMRELMHVRCHRCRRHAPEAAEGWALVVGVGDAQRNVQSIFMRRQPDSLPESKRPPLPLAEPRNSPP
jgi:hypothetical protein